MFEITVKAMGLYNNWMSHCEIKIQDMSSPEECYIISVNPDQLKKGTNKPSKIESFDSEATLACAKPEKISIYSNRDTTLEDFIQDIEEQCLCPFELCWNNCSDAANYAINYFFPRSENVCTEATWQAYKFLTFPFCIATLGCTPFFGAPPLINAPYDIYRKAQLLSRDYGDPVQLELRGSEEPSVGYFTLNN